MLVYLLSFLISLLLIGFTEKKHKTVFIISSAVAVLIPCMVAALRADSVGTDIHVYVRPMFENARNSLNFSQYWNSSWYHVWHYKYVYEHEVGFSALLYVVARLTGSMGCVLFSIQAFTVLPVYIALSLDRKKAPVWPGMLVYYLLYFNCTLNMMRQWMAMGVLLLAYQLLLRKKYGGCLLLFCVAFLFHYSSLIFLPIVAVWWFLDRFKKRTLVQGSIRISTKTLMVLLIFALGVLVLLNLKLILQLVTALGLTRFTNYLKGGTLSLMLGQFVLRLPVICITLLSWKRLRKATHQIPFLLSMLILDLLAAQIVSIAKYALRISYFFACFTILLVPYLFQYQRSRFEKTAVVLGLTGFYLFYWFYFYIYTGAHETYPYHFAFMRN